ncbi:MAG: XRE family transcriptional regulator [Pedobacter sp.]|nr:MAG: XRE family transcriptional regulator [Pedobacter sp.]
MGELLERAIRRKGLNITELALALNITRRTLYNWFKQEVIDEATMEKISSVIKYEFNAHKSNPTIIKVVQATPLIVKDEAYWQDRYIDLLERYAKLLQE